MTKIFYHKFHRSRHCGLDPQSAHYYEIAGQARNDGLGIFPQKILFGVNSNMQKKNENLAKIIFFVKKIVYLCDV